MLDMNKAVDSVIRETLYENQKPSNEDKLHVITILLKDVRTKNQINWPNNRRVLQNECRSMVGVTPADGLNQILFTLYLAKALEENPNQTLDLLQDHL